MKNVADFVGDYSLNMTSVREELNLGVLTVKDFRGWVYDRFTSVVTRIFRTG